MRSGDVDTKGTVHMIGKSWIIPIVAIIAIIAALVVLLAVGLFAGDESDVGPEQQPTRTATPG